MKHYEKMIQLGCFSRHSLAGALGCGLNTAATTIGQYLKKGYIERVRHDCYAVISLETKQPVPSRYQIGGSLFPDGCVSHHSAFEVYGCANQVFYEVYVATNSRFKDFSYNGVLYRRVAPRTERFITNAGPVRLTTVERTVVDSIADLSKIAGLEEILRCILLVPSLDGDILLEILEEYQNGFLYQKCGLILEAFNDTIGLPVYFFEKCQEHIPGTKRYLVEKQREQVLYKKWNLYAPKGIQNILQKGVSVDDTV